MASADGIPEIEKGLVQWARVTNVISPNIFQAQRLAEYGDSYFAFWTVYVLRDVRSTPVVPVPPQGQQQIATAFAQVGGSVTHPAFTAPMVVGDEILMIHPNLGAGIGAAIAAVLLRLGAADTSVLGSLYGILGNPAVNLATSLALALARLGAADTSVLGSLYGILGNPAVDVSTMLAIILAAIGPTGAQIGLYYHGLVTAAVAPSFTIAAMAGLGAGKFADVTAPYWAFVMRSHLGLSGAPQGEMQAITIYDTATGTFTTAAYTVAVAIGDEILIIHPRLAEIARILTNVGDASAHALKSIVAKLGNNATDFNTRIGNPDADTLKSLVAKWGDITRSLKLLLGARWNAAGDLGTDIAALLGAVGGGGSPPIPGPTLLDMVSRPRVEIYEPWQDEAGIDLGVWTPTNPATGTAWQVVPVGEDMMAWAVPAASENCRLVSVHRWVACPTLFGTNKIVRRMTLEFELRLGIGFINFDNTAFFIGLASAANATRATNNLIGFALVGGGNALQTLTDDGIGETVNTGFGEDLTNKNKLKIDCYLNTVDFYLNETKIATHVANLPSVPMFLNFYAALTAGGPATFYLGVIRAWQEDIAR